MDPEPERSERLGMNEVRDRAARGAAILGARGALVMVVGIVANIVLARLLVPSDFGLVALGSVLLVVGTYITDGGLGAALIRRERPPERIELQAVAGLQIALAALMAAAGGAIAASFGRDGLVVALMLASLPITSLRLPAGIVLERQLLYRPIALVDLIEALAYYAWALGTVALGAGVWGLASAVVVRAVVGVAAMARLGPFGILLPRWSWAHVRPLAAFGAKLQATTIVSLVRDQGLNVGVAAIAGIATLGVWNLAYRILQVPTLLINTAVRVSFPAMSRMMGANEDPRAAIERGVAIAAVGIGAVLVAIVGCAPAAFPALLGPGWEDVPATALWASLGMILSAPVVVATIGYLYATDNAGAVVWGTTWQTVAWLGVTLPLVPVVGAPAVGIGWVPAGLALATICGRRAARLTGAAIVRNLAVPVLAAVAGGAAGWAVADAGPQTVPLGAAGLLVGELVFLSGLALLRRPLLTQAWDLVARALQSSSSPEPRETPVA